VFVVGAGRTQYDCHHDTKVKPEAATALSELLVMGGKTSETCWAVNERQDNKLEKCCIWLVIYLNWTKTELDSKGRDGSFCTNSFLIPTNANSSLQQL